MAQLNLTARALKITVPLDVAEVAALPDPGGQARSQLAITCDGKIYSADIATKSLRKAKATIATSGAENVFVMVQGKLRNNEIIECGLVAQVKTPKPAPRCALNDPRTTILAPMNANHQSPTRWGQKQYEFCNPVNEGE